MKFEPISLAFAAVLSITGNAPAQQLDNRQIIDSLGELQGAAPAVDLALLNEELNAHLGQGVAQLPHWSTLATLPQFAVEVDFENDFDRDRAELLSQCRRHCRRAALSASAALPLPGGRPQQRDRRRRARS